MIDPKLLTKEAGFVGGEWIEIDHHVMKWHGLELYDDEYIGWIVGEYENIDPAEVTSIRPLTGPIAIWNFAPEWAEWCGVSKLNVTWWDHEPPKQFDWTEVSKRPFWAAKKA